MQSTEIWRPVPGYAGYYEVSDLGRVRRIKTHTGEPRVLSPSTSGSGGYRLVGLSRDGVAKTHAVHVIVAEVFERGVGPLVRHLDGDPANNAASNLMRGTNSENLLDAVRHGTYRNGNLGRTVCHKGHALTPENTYIRPKTGMRACRQCKRKRTRDWKREKRRKAS